MEQRLTMRRPMAVAVSSWLLTIGAVLGTADLWLSYRWEQAHDEAYWAAVDANEIENATAFAAITVVAGLFIALLRIIGAISLVVIAVQNLRGRRTSRTATWMVSGLMLCCPSVNVATLADSSAAPTAPIPSANGWTGSCQAGSATSRWPSTSAGSPACSARRSC